MNQLQHSKTFISLFGGIGGFDLPLTKNGWKCVGYYEIDKYAVQTYNKNFGTEYKEADIRELDVKSIRDHTLLCAGFPCQSFSIAGERKGFNDARGNLFFEIVRIIKTKRPKLLLLENVKGLLNHEKGETFRVILQTLDELGYDVQWQVLNSKNYGVAQHRERVFIIGYKRGECIGQIFPIRYNSQESCKENKKRLELLYDGDYQSKRIYSMAGLSPTIPTSKSGGNHIPFVADIEAYKEVDSNGM